MDGRAELDRHIKATTTRAAFCDRVGCSEGFLSEFIKGKKNLSLPLAIKFSRETADRDGGPIPVEAFDTEAAEAASR